MAAFRRRLLSPVKQRLFMLSQLPAAGIAGVRVERISLEAAAVSVPFTYFTKNPFRSIYFACQSMAAEMASGVLAMMHATSGTPVSMLVVGMEAEFHKKATSRIVFESVDGAAIAQAVAESRQTGEGRTVRTASTGRDAAGDVVAVFYITWSFRAKRRSFREIKQFAVNYFGSFSA
ncbi:thioesterase [Solirubrum puertoriconensis]|uniref:Thioesterase n=1 Tax=Solirubrum puertoriconensis TaxID=1751427 RepID=A0A9X0HJN2_SOLP1|nr:thioesterase [Solirubrum puertoriconensis]